MPKTKEQCEKIRILTNEKIRNAGIQLFALKSFAATSVQDIADLSGISTGLLYRHYKSKEELFYELVIQAGEALEGITHVFQSDESPYILLKQVMQEMLKAFSVDDKIAQYFILIEQSFKMKDTMPQIMKLIEKDIVLIKNTASLIERGQKLGQFIEGDSYKMAILYFSIIQGLASIKFVLEAKDKFVAPSLEMAMAFLIRENPIKST